MRVCKECGIDYECFGLKHRLCRPCKQAYDREYHANRTPEKRTRKIELQTIRYKENRQKIYEYLLRHPCEICGEADPVVLEFDHIEQGSKEFSVANMKTHAWSTIENEISKCRVLCANCHRRHTAVQLGWYKDLTR
jgi:hypothetical protein